MDVKQFIKDYYENLLTPENLKNFLHPQAIIEWHSQRGYVEMDTAEIVKFMEVVSRNNTTLRFRVTHLVAEGEDKVAAKYINYLESADDLNIEKEVSHGISIWELKDNKLYRGYIITNQIS